MPSELREALLAANATALIPKIIDPILLEYQRRYSPLCRSIPTVKWDSDTYYFNQRTQVAMGGWVSDGGAQPVNNSTYVQQNFKMAHIQVVGAVTGYAQNVTRQVIGDLRHTEIEGSIRGIYWDIETGILWGNAGTTQFGARPQYDGLSSLVATFTGANQNAQDKAGGTLTLAMLDELIDMVEQNAAMSVFDDSWQIVMSNTAISKIAQLLTNQQRFNDRVEIAAGLLVPTYRDIPLIKSSFLSTRALSMGTVTTTTATSGGTLAAATYYYRVAPVIARQGEMAASAEVSQATTGTTSIATLAFATPAGLDGAQPVLYGVYRSTATGTETLLGYVDAIVGLGADGVTPILTTSIIDTGTALVPQNGSTVPAAGPASYVGTNTGLYPPAVGLENIYLMSRDRNFLIRPYVREVQPLDVYPTTSSPDTLPYALVTDTCLALRAPKYTGRIARVAVGV
jgi:hypothetical protein